jgi:hypothetical protein
MEALEGEVAMPRTHAPKGSKGSKVSKVSKQSMTRRSAGLPRRPRSTGAAARAAESQALGRAIEPLEQRWLLSTTIPSGLALAAASDSNVVGDRITNIRALTITGSGTVGNTVSVFDGATLVGTGVVAANGTWSITTANQADGSHLYAASATDGTTTSARSPAITVTVDTVAPVITATRNTAANANGWNNSNVTTSYSTVESGSGLAFGNPANGTFIFTTEGAGQSHTFTVMDNAGNTASASIGNVNIDKTAPTISATRLTAPNANGWNNTDVNTSFSAGDALSGLNASSPASGSFAFTVEAANQSKTFTATDLAGNSASVTISGVSIDKTAPVMNTGRSNLPNANGWNNTNVGVNYTASDNLSGLNGSSPATGSFTFTAEGAGQSKSFTVTDRAGNTTTKTISNVNIDKTAPEVTGSPDRAPNAAGWYNANVTVSFSGSDVLSGLLGVSSPTVMTFNGIGQSVTGTATDLAGNVATFTVSGIKIDKTAPTLNVWRDEDANAYGWNNTDVTVSYTAGDMLSGLIDPNSDSYTFSDEGAGQSKTFTVRDAAGNVATYTFNVSIDKTAPTITGSADRAANAHGWYNADVIVSFTSSDNGGSGLLGATSDVTLGEGTDQFVTGVAMDLAGNMASFTLGGFNIDETAPTLNVHRENAPNAAGWNTTDVAFSYLAGDALSGLDGSDVSGEFVFSNEGANQSHTFTVMDLAGNVSTVTVGNVNIDKTAPTLSVSTDGTANQYGWFNHNLTVTVLAGDAVSGLVMDPSDVIVLGEGANQSITVTAMDQAGNLATFTLSGINIDTTAPTLNVVRTAANSYGWNNGDVNSSYTASDGLSGLLSDSSGSYLFSEEGEGQTHTFTVMDRAGNVATYTVTANIDKTAPSLDAVRNTLANGFGWNNTNVLTSFTAGDDLSGLAGANSGSFTFSSEGANQSHTFTVMDRAGNVTTVTIGGVNIDKTAPTMNASRSTPANANGWNNTDVATSFTASDALSGLLGASSGSFVFSEEGAGQSHTFTVTDRAGNVATVTFGNVNIDKTAPTLNVVRNTAANANGWNNTNVSTSWTAGDAMSGLTSGSGTFVFSSEGAGQSHIYTATDLAGNTVSVTIGDVNIDKTAPTLDAARTTLANSLGWNRSNVLSSYTASDALSGLVEASSGGYTFTGEGANMSHTFTVTDLAGNTTSVTIGGVNIDRTAPVLSLPSNIVTGPDNRLGATVFYNDLASDALSGLNALINSVASGSVFSVGSTVVQVTATDKAGNTVTGSFTVTVNPVGIGTDGNLYVLAQGSSSTVRIDARNRNQITVSGVGNSSDSFRLGPSGHIIFWGTAGVDDVMVNGKVDSELHGLGGNDVLHGGSGNDSLYGGTGNDKLVGGGGNDVIVQEGDTTFSATPIKPARKRAA